MGSFFAGIKAGTLAGTVYFGGLAAFNVALMYAFKPAVLTLIEQSYSQVCSSSTNATAAAVNDCFSSVVMWDVPTLAFLGFSIALVYAGAFGGLYESVPGGTRPAKGMLVAALVGVTLLLLNLAGIYFDALARFAIVAFLLVWTPVYGLLLGRLYGGYTRTVQFVGQPEGMKINVDGRDRTGEARTFALKSSHGVRAEPPGGGSFRGWAVSGGVTVDDPKSFETTMEVEGDGMLKAQGGPRS